MKKFLCLLLSCMLALSVCACGAQNIEEEVEVPDIQVVKPLSGMDIDSLEDATLQVEFNEDDLSASADGYALTVRVYDMVLYDAVEVSLLEPGKTFVDENGKEIAVESIENVDGIVNINGGIEGGGISLCAGDGGTYRLESPTDYGVMYLVGERTYPISEDCIITDSADLDNQNVTVALSDFGALLQGEMNNFNCYNTSIRIVEGKIVEITRYYMP